MKKSLALAVALALVPLAVRAQAPYLVKDINTTANQYPNSSVPSGFIKFGSRVFFGAYDLDVFGAGPKLWSTDGTEAGTTMVKDFSPGDGNPPSRFVVLNDKLIFNAVVRSDEELWVSDGTSAGTRLLADINPSGSSSPGDRIVYHGKLIFSAREPIDGRELWITDGTPAGTKSLKDLKPGPADSSPVSFVIFNDTVYFGTIDGLWKTDGTESGTVQLNSAFSTNNLTVAGSRLFFTGGGNVWVSDGTEAGTHSVAAVTSAYGMAAFGDKVLFVASVPGMANEPWISDGTAAGTHLVRDIDPDTPSLAAPFFTVLGNFAYFSAFTIKNGRELWRTDGTEAGTVMVKDIAPGNLSGNPQGLIVFNGKLYFAATPSGSAPFTLWESDGTNAGTRQVSSAGVLTSSDPPLPSVFTNIDGVLYFSGANALNGYELWKSDGTAAGTVMIKNLLDDGAPSSSPRNFFAAGDLVYFDAWDGSGALLPNTSDTPRSLWRSDGTDAGTVKLADFAPNSGSYVAGPGHSIYFTKGNDLWTSDGTPQGTGPATALLSRFPKTPSSISIAGNTIFASIQGTSQSETWATTTALDAPAVPLGVNGFGFVDVAGRTMFSTSSFSGSALWVSDGTAAGTYSIANAGFTFGTSKLVIGGQLYFVNGANLWKSDGTPEGTAAVVKTMPPGATNLIAAGNKIFFLNGSTLWVTDGTDAGTRALPATALAGLAAAGDRVVFSANDAAHGRELWVSDGTADGTHLLVDIYATGTYATSPGSSPVAFTSIGSLVYFSAFDEVHGSVPWTTDGTVEGTKPAPGVGPYDFDSAPTSYVKAGQHVFFTAITTATGGELWAFALPPQLSIGDVRVAEGDAGTTTARFTVTLSSAQSQPVKVDYATSDGSAVAGTDYDAASGTLTFAPGETAKTIDVRVRGNAVTQTNRVFNVTLRNAAGASLDKAAAVGIIEDDDQIADLGLSLDFSLFGSGARVGVNASDSGPSTATGIKFSSTVTPGGFSCSPCGTPPQVLPAGATAFAFSFENSTQQEYVTTTATARQRDPQPANNSVGWTANEPLAMDALFLTPGADANVWVYAFTSTTTLSISSSDAAVLTVPSTLPNPTLGKAVTFPVHATGIGRATIRVFTPSGTIGTLIVDVVAPGTKPRWPGINRINTDTFSLPFDQAVHLTVESGGVAPGGATITGTVVVTAGAQELGRVTLDGKSPRVTFPVYLPALGANAITATYSGDANFLPSATPFTITTTTGSATILPAGVRVGNAATVTVAVTGSPAGAPTGTVTIAENGVIAARQATLAPSSTPGISQATITLANLPAGQHTLTVSYSGDAKYRSGTQSYRLTDARPRAARH